MRPGHSRRQQQHQQQQHSQQQLLLLYCCVAVLVASCCRTPHKWLLGLRTMDCECDSECNRFWAGRASLLTYMGRIAHRLPPLPVHPPLPVLPVQQLDKSSCAWKFHPSRRVESCKSCLESFIGYGKAATERGRQVKQGKGRGEERKWAGWRWNDCMWLEGKQCRLMGAFQQNWTLLFRNWMPPIEWAETMPRNKKQEVEQIPKRQLEYYRSQ